MKSVKSKIEALAEIKIHKPISLVVKKEMREIIWHGITHSFSNYRVEILDKLINGFQRSK